VLARRGLLSGAAMEMVIGQIHTLSTRNDSDLKKLKDFLRHEQESLKAHAGQIDQALPLLDPVQHTMGVAFLLAAQCMAGTYSNQQATFAYVGNFLKAADEQQVKKASVPVNTVCKCYAQMAIDDGQQAMLRSIMPLHCAIEKLRHDAETLTPVHAEYLRVCLKVKAYHLGGQILDQPIFDISPSGGNSTCTQMTAACFLSYFYYGALIRIGMKEYGAALQLLMVALTCPSTCLSAIQADAYKKYVLISLLVNGELPSLPVYASPIIQRHAKSNGYVLDIAEAFKQGERAGLAAVVEEKASQINADNNMGLVKQVVESLRRHKVQTLTKTYLTLSLVDIARELGMEGRVAEVEDLLFDMISSDEINARIDQSTGNVSFEEDDGEMDAGMANQLQDKLAQIMEVAGRIQAFEEEVITSETYIRKTAAMEGDRSVGATALGGYDFMDM
jgi:COP9 signalosome complex subunit 3